MSQGKIAAVAPIMQASPAETPAPKLSEEQAKRLEQLREVREKREAAEAQAAEIRELEAEELALTLETQGGRRGEDFEVLTNRFGVFAIKKPDTQAIRNWENSPWALSPLLVAIRKTVSTKIQTSPRSCLWEIGAPQC